ncbi:hypothetical protein ACFU7T_12825 [Streptomyces sp. NPDC057555]|uniref:hypothetical protein n=1 Tax=Streptomyces sp. NPDC057555 TaxID=3346166 RepID=UPI0036C73146
MSEVLVSRNADCGLFLMYPYLGLWLGFGLGFGFGFGFGFWLGLGLWFRFWLGFRLGFRLRLWLWLWLGLWFRFRLGLWLRFWLGFRSRSGFRLKTNPIELVRMEFELGFRPRGSAILRLRTWAVSDDGPNSSVNVGVEPPSVP